MEILRYALGIRFDSRKIPQGDTAYHAFELIYSILSYKELKYVRIHGGFPYDDEPHIYVMVFEAHEYKTVRKIFKLLDADSALKLFLTDELPFLDKNRLQHVRELTVYGSYDYVNHTLPNAPISVYKAKISVKRKDIRGRKYNFLLAPDTFKGTIASIDAVRLLTLAARESHYRGCKITALPIADGGEGTLYAMHNIVGGELKTVSVHDALGNNTDAQYAVINSDTALIEMAQASGLTLIPENKRNIKKASSYGTGELIMAAINDGYRKIIVALGGSATNDGGMGCASAMGVKFLDAKGNEVPVCGEGLIKVRGIDTSYVPAAVRETRFTIMSDVQNPLTGLDGATMMFSAQKGADAVTMFELESGMKNYRRCLNNLAGYDICKRKGAGAAGGMGAMLLTLFNAKMLSGIDTLLDLAHFEKKAKQASFIITGEGKFDSQTLSGGKAVAGILKRSGKAPVALICGCVDETAAQELYGVGAVTAVRSFMKESESKESCYCLFYNSAQSLFSLIHAGSKLRRR